MFGAREAAARPALSMARGMAAARVGAVARTLNAVTRAWTVMASAVTVAGARTAASGVGLLALLAWTGLASAAVPDLSGYWDLTMKVAPDGSLMRQLPPGTVVLHDTGPVELPAGDFGGLKIKPKALAAALAWKPLDDMTLSKACQPPSIIYAMQGPFPMEIYQGPKFIIMKLAYYDMVRIIFMDGRKPPAGVPDTKTGYSVGHWEGSTLVVETTHLEAATITNNGLSHSNKVRVLERFKLGPDGQTLLSTQEFEDPEVLDAPGARFIAWRRKPGHFVPPYECDPSFVLNYQQAQQGKAETGAAKPGGATQSAGAQAAGAERRAAGAERSPAGR